MGETSPVTCAELEGQQMVFLAANVSCTDRWYNVLRKYSFATEGVGLFSVAVVGVLANLLSIAVLCQRTMKTQITALLITLAIFDILFLICTLPVFTVQSVNEFVAYLNECYYDKYNNSTSRIELMSPKLSDVYHYLLPFLYGLTHVSKVGSVFTTLAVSLERYFAVCRPLWIRIRRMHPALYIVLVTVFAFAFNVPKFLEFEAIDDLDGRTIINPTELRTNRHYVVYYNFVTKTLLTELFPYVSLIFFNVCIFREIRRSVEIQKAMRCTQSQKEEIKSANVVVGIVLMSILCHIWKIVPDLYEAITRITHTENETSNFTHLQNCSVREPVSDVPALDIEMIIDTSHLLVGINSAANFFVYYLLRKNFRSATWRLLTCKSLEDQRRNNLLAYQQASVRRTQSTCLNSTVKRPNNGFTSENINGNFSSRHASSCRENGERLSSGGQRGRLNARQNHHQHLAVRQDIEEEICLVELNNHESNSSGSKPQRVKGSFGSSSQCIDYESNGSDKAVGTGGAGNTLAIEDKGLEEEEKVLVEEAEEAEEEVLVASRDHCVTRSTFV